MNAARPSLTLWVAALIAGAWALVAISGRLEQFAALGGLIPGRLSGVVDVPGAIPAWLTPITSSFLHAGIVHLGLNLLMLVFCGRQVEPALGGKLLALALLVSAYAAALGEWLWNPAGNAIIIGASGVTSGLVGLYAVIYNTQAVPAIGPIPPYIVRIAWLAAAWIGLQALIGFAFGGQIAVMAHIGGFVAGLLMARPLLRWRYAGRP